MIKPTWPQVRCHNCGIEAHWREMVMKKEALHIQETKQDAEDQCVKWHLCLRCEALQTGQTEAEVIEATFKKPKEHKLHRVQHYQEMLKKNSQKKNLLKHRKCRVQHYQEMFPPSKAPAVDAGLRAAVMQRLEERLQEHKELECGNQVVPEVDDKCIAFASKGEAQQSYMPAFSYQDEWVSSKDRTCSCNGSLQILAACCTLCVVRV